MHVDGTVASPLAATDVITSLTVQPLRGLKFNDAYTLTLGAGIVDQNTPPLNLPRYTLTFTTESPVNLGSASDQAATRAVVLESYSYTGVPTGASTSGVDVVDLTNSSAPKDLGVQAGFIGRAVDVAANPSFTYTPRGGSQVTAPMLAVAAGVGPIPLPSNVWLFDLTNPAVPKPIGGLSVSSSTSQDGSLLRIAILNQTLYTSTYPKGLQVVDLNQATTEMAQADQAQMGQDLTTEGNGFALDAVINTIPIQLLEYAGGCQPTPQVTCAPLLDQNNNPIQIPGTMYDLKVADFPVASSLPGGPAGTQIYMVATGVLPLVVADPDEGGDGLVYPPQVTEGQYTDLSRQPLSFTDFDTAGQYSLQSGSAVALGTIPLTSGGTTTNTAIGVVVGSGVANNTTSPSVPLLAVVDLSDPTQPQVQGGLLLPVQPTDVSVSGTFALVGTNAGKIIVVNLQDPTHPVVAGQISGNYGEYVTATNTGLVVGDALANGSTSSGVETAVLQALVAMDLGMCDCAGKAGGPINVTNGNIWITHQDYQLPGLGGGISVSRTWNSFWSQSNPPQMAGVFGDSWRSTYEERLQTGSGSILYWRSTGDHWTFTPDPTTQGYTVSSPQDEHATLAQNAASGNYVITFADGSKETFLPTGYLLSLADRNGNQTTVTYDTANRITQVTDAAGRVLNFNYPDGKTAQAQSLSDAVGTVATYAYASYCPAVTSCTNLLKTVTYADGSSLNFQYTGNLITNVADGGGKTLEAHTYDSSGRGLTSAKANGVEMVSVTYTASGTTEVTNSAGAQTRYSYYPVGGRTRVSSITGPGCATCSSANSSFAYDANGNKTAITDANGNTVQYTYDASSNVLSSTAHADANTPVTTQYTYNSFGQVLTSTDPLGNVTTNSYDAKGNLLSTTTPSPDGVQSPSVTKFGYDAKGELTSITDPLNHVTTLAYNSAGLVQSVTDAQSNTTQYGYDARGNRTSVTDALQNVTKFAYDAMNRLTNVTYPDNSTASFAYDYRGRRISSTDGNSHVTYYAYDDADRLVSVTDAANNVTTYAYDNESNLISITDAANHVTSFTYDSQNRVVQTTFPSKLAETYTYDNNSNLLSKTDRKQQTISYAYDSLNRLLSKSTGAQYKYDLDSRLQQVADSTGTYGFQYDNLGRLLGTTTQYSFLPGQTFGNKYMYDAASNRTGYTDPASGGSTYGYDTLNRLTALNAAVGGQFTFGYDALSRRNQLGRPNGVNTTYQYDNLSRLQAVLHQTGAGASASTADGTAYTYDNAGNRTSKTNQMSGVTENYGYDSIYELTQVMQAGSVTEAYSYDAVGNRLSTAVDSGWNYNSSNELTARPGLSYTYDNNGNMLTRSDGTQFTWDVENRLTQVTQPGGGTVTFEYDPFGRRIQKSSAAGTTNYVYDGANVAVELDASGSVLAEYTQGPSIDEPLAMQRNGLTAFYQADGLGSITSLTDTFGAATDSYAYSSFGSTIISGGTTNPYRYTGREWDAETGLYYYRARYYDPAIGRFISEDQLGFGGGNDFYSYAGNAPNDIIDPSGLCKVQMIYTPVKVLGLTVAYHALLVVSNNTGGAPNPQYFRGGPGQGDILTPIHGPYINDPKLNPDWDPSATSQTLLDDTSDCKCLVNKLDRYNLQVTLAQIPYRRTTTNSNAYAHGAAQAGGLNVPIPPVDVPGWNTPLQVKPIPGSSK